MKKLMKNIAVILGFGLIGLTTTANAQYPKTKAPGEICYYFNSQGLLGEWEEELLVFAEKTGVPVASTLLGLGAFPANHPICWDGWYAR